MPGLLLHKDARVNCAHQGTAQPMTVDPKVKVSGHQVVVQTTSYGVTGCTQPPPTSGNGPCATAQWTSAATKVKASGIPVLLANGTSICTPTGTPLQVASTQTTVRGT